MRVLHLAIAASLISGPQRPRARMGAWNFAAIGAWRASGSRLRTHPRNVQSG